MQKLLKLFEELNEYLQIYFHAYNEFRTQALKEDVESKKKAAIEQMQDALILIEDVIEKIESCYSDELRLFYETLSKDEIEELNSEYMESINRLDNIQFSLKLPALQKYTEVVDLHKRLITRFNVMENNIKVYNNSEVVQNFGFKIISPEEAHKKYGEMRAMIEEENLKNYDN